MNQKILIIGIVVLFAFVIIVMAISISESEKDFTIKVVDADVIGIDDLYVFVGHKDYCPTAAATEKTIVLSIKNESIFSKMWDPYQDKSQSPKICLLSVEDKTSEKYVFDSFYNSVTYNGEKVTSPVRVLPSEEILVTFKTRPRQCIFKKYDDYAKLIRTNENYDQIFSFVENLEGFALVLGSTTCSAYNPLPLPADSEILEILPITGKMEKSNYPEVIEVNSCQNLETKNATYKLTTDISIPENGPSTCFTIAADNVTVNCQNHKISGTGKPNTSGLFSKFTSGSVIENCKIENWGEGINLVFAETSRISSNRFTQNKSGLWIENSNEMKIEGNEFSENGFGIYFYNTTNSSVNSNVLLNNNTGIMMTTYDGYPGIDFASNAICDNIVADIFCKDGNAFNDNGSNQWSSAKIGENTTLNPGVLVKNQNACGLTPTPCT